jgi:hypothetical protein
MLAACTSLLAYLLRLAVRWNFATAKVVIMTCHQIPDKQLDDHPQTEPPLRSEDDTASICASESGYESDDEGKGSMQERRRPRH